MRLLSIFDGRRAIQHLQIDYIYRLRKWFDIVIYGPNEYELKDHDMSPIQFSNKLSIMDLCKEFKPDIILLPEYVCINPLLSFLGDLSKVDSIPIVSIEDVWYDNEKGWHLRNGIDCVVSRVPIDQEFFSVPSVWLPWAADDSFSNISTDWDSRYNKVLFIGEGIYSKNMAYATRRRATRILSVNDLLDSFRAETMEFYKDKLGEYKYFLSDSWNELKMPPPKTFESMAAGCTTLSTLFIGEKELFGDNVCYVSYDMDCSNLLSKVENCMNDTEASKQIASLGREIVLKNHMMFHRIEELKDILFDVLYRKDVRRKWGR
jgi:hypothetical protein